MTARKDRNFKVAPFKVHVQKKSAQIGWLERDFDRMLLELKGPIGAKLGQDGFLNLLKNPLSVGFCGRGGLERKAGLLVIENCLILGVFFLKDGDDSFIPSVRLFGKLPGRFSPGGKILR